ncbi:hypothetical protein F183_A25900 [Bryobacterales bacterium F-183]|nr:hypothetical protein F183_A25900 [Bryobacterales bacterium F-183]
MTKPLLLLLAAATSLTCFAQDFTWNGTIPQGKAIEIKGINGFIHAEAASGNLVEVSAKKTAVKGNPADVRIEIVPTDNGITICALYSGASTNSCTGVGEQRRNNNNGNNWGNNRDNDVKVDFTVKVPAGVKFIGNNVNGDIEARNLKSDANVHTVNGSIEASASGVVEGHTVNGNVKVIMGTAPTRALSFHTVNGTIEVSMPAGAGAQMEAHTVNGNISSDFPMQVQGEISRKKVNAKLGNGGPALKLHTVNGSIRVKQA